MSVKKMTTVSIRVRQDDYAILQQHAQDNGLKCPAMFSQILAEWIEMHSLVKEDNSNGTDATGVAKIGEDVMNELVMAFHTWAILPVLVLLNSPVGSTRCFLTKARLLALKD